MDREFENESIGADPDDPTWCPEPERKIDVKVKVNINWNWSDILERAFATAWQTAIPALVSVVPSAIVITDWGQWKVALISIGITVGQGLLGFFLSVFKNMRKQRLEQIKAAIAAMERGGAPEGTMEDDIEIEIETKETPAEETPEVEAPTRVDAIFNATPLRASGRANTPT